MVQLEGLDAKGPKRPQQWYGHGMSIVGTPQLLGYRLFAVLLLIFGLAGPAVAHDFWIEPTDFWPAPGDRVPLLLRVGQDLSGERLPYMAEWFSDYRVVAPSGTRPITGVSGDDPAGYFDALEAGMHVVGYHSNRDFVELGAEKFRDYLQDEGLESIIALRAARGESELPAREYYSRCAKSLLVAGDGNPETAFGTELGYSLELVPELNPNALQPGDKLPLRLLYLGEGIPGVLVQASSADSPDRMFQARTDAAGRVSIPIAERGLWLIKAVHMVELRSPMERADWESFWASLTFRL
jgi:uncharacterized GH25 family protein